MIIVLSPAKTLDFGDQCLTGKHSLPDYLAESGELIAKLVKLRKPALKNLMGISENLAGKRDKPSEKTNSPGN